DRTTVTRSMTLASLGRCSHTPTPGTDVATGRNSPPISTGASGLRSHMSTVDGPPFRNTRMTPVARLPARLARPAWARRLSARVSPNNPAAPTWRNDRRSTAVLARSHRFRIAFHLRARYCPRLLVDEDEFPGVQQGPKQSLQPRFPISLLL